MSGRRVRGQRTPERTRQVTPARALQNAACMTFIVITILLLAALAAQACALRAVQRTHGLAPLFTYGRPAPGKEPTP